MEKIKNRETLMAFIREVEQIAVEQGWMNRKAYPYPSTPMTVKQLLSECRDYDRCTSGSKAYLICLAEGYRQIFETWMHVDAKVKVRRKDNGKVMVISIELAKKLTEEMPELLEIID